MPRHAILRLLCRRRRTHQTKKPVCMEIHYAICEEELFAQQWASFESNPVTGPVIIQCNTWYRMKDMDIIFALAPLTFMWFIGMF